MNDSSRPRDVAPSSTVCVHAGEPADASTGACEPPLHMAVAFAFDDAAQAAGAFTGENDHLIYGRWRNPTVHALELKIAALEAGASPDYECVATASGMAAITAAVLTCCSAGDHVVAPRSMYGESSRLLRERLPRFGIETTFVDQTSASAYAGAIRPNTKLLYVETPANPTLLLTDLRAVVALAREKGLRVLVDSTFATPYCQRPLAFGVDLVVHSMTKAIGGHGDAIGGAIVGGRAIMAGARELAVKSFGGVLSPFNAMLVARGIRTLSLRQKQACATASVLANALAESPHVARVHYPGHASHPQHVLAKSQMSAFGSLVAFEAKGGIAQGRRVLEKVKVVTHAVSLGDVRSLVTHPASTTHASMPADARHAGGIGDGLIRVSCGIEETNDVVDDVLRALD